MQRISVFTLFSALFSYQAQGSATISASAEPIKFNCYYTEKNNPDQKGHVRLFNPRTNEDIVYYAPFDTLFQEYIVSRESYAQFVEQCQEEIGDGVFLSLKGARIGLVAMNYPIGTKSSSAVLSYGDVFQYHVGGFIDSEHHELQKVFKTNPAKIFGLAWDTLKGTHRETVHKIKKGRAIYMLFPKQIDFSVPPPPVQEMSAEQLKQILRDVPRMDMQITENGGTLYDSQRIKTTPQLAATLPERVLIQQLKKYLPSMSQKELQDFVRLIIETRTQGYEASNFTPIYEFFQEYDSELNIKIVNKARTRHSVNILGQVLEMKSQVTYHIEMPHHKEAGKWVSIGQVQAERSMVFDFVLKRFGSDIMTLKKVE